MTVGDLKQLFGAAVKHERSQLGISQEELAERAGLHRTYVSDVERGARNLSLESIEKLASALKLSISRLFNRAGDRNPLMEILLVEDDPHDIELTLRAFRRARFANPVRLIRDGAEALDFLLPRPRGPSDEEQLPGVILLDLDLPRIDGLEVLRRVKADARTRHIPIVVLSASQQPSDLAASRRLGAETYIVKPVDFKNFSEAMPNLDFDWTLVRHEAEKETQSGSPFGTDSSSS